MAKTEIILPQGRETVLVTRISRHNGCGIEIHDPASTERGYVVTGYVAQVCFDFIPRCGYDAWEYVVFPSQESLDEWAEYCADAAADTDAYIGRLANPTKFGGFGQGTWFDSFLRTLAAFPEWADPASPDEGAAAS